MQLQFLLDADQVRVGITLEEGAVKSGVRVKFWSSCEKL
jgi:hypothetical protein